MSEEQGWLRVIAKAEPKFTEIAAADGNLVTFKREAMFAHQVIELSSYLQQCTPDSIFNAIVNVASVGITLSPAEKLAYLVPRYNKDLKANLCCLDISYRGLKHIAESSGSIHTAVAELVRERDTWKWVDKLSKPVHEYDPLAPANHRGDVRGGYCIAVLPNGVIQCEPMSLEEIEKAQNVSAAKNGPWKTWWEEMAKKTLVRRASKMWPHSRRLAEASAVLDMHQGLENLLPEPGAEAAAPVPQPVETGSPPEPGSRDDGPKESKKAAEDPNAGKPMIDGQRKIILARAKGAKIETKQLVEKFGAEDTWTFGGFAKMQAWIAAGGKDPA